MTFHEQYMRLALNEARAAFDEGEVPVGAVVVWGERVIGRGHNQMERLNDATAHAEMIAVTAAEAALESRRLDQCRIYVTLEPCPMCAGAIVNARLGELYFGAFDPKAGAVSTLYAITTDRRLNHRVETVGGMLDAECAALLDTFFKERRRERRNGHGPEGDERSGGERISGERIGGEPDGPGPWEDR